MGCGIAVQAHGHHPNSEALLDVMDVKIFEENEESLALLKLLEMGSKEIEQGKFRDAEAVFFDLDVVDLR